MHSKIDRFSILNYKKSHNGSLFSSKGKLYFRNCSQNIRNTTVREILVRGAIHCYWKSNRFIERWKTQSDFEGLGSVNFSVLRIQTALRVCHKYFRWWAEKKKYISIKSCDWNIFEFFIRTKIVTKVIKSNRFQTLVVWMSYTGKKKVHYAIWGNMYTQKSYSWLFSVFQCLYVYGIIVLRRLRSWR